MTTTQPDPAPPTDPAPDDDAPVWRLPSAHSVSAVTTYEHCPRQWQYRFVDRRRPPEDEKPWHVRRGIVVHAGLQAAYEAHRAHTGPTPSSMLHWLGVAEEAVGTSWAELRMGEPLGSEWNDTLRHVALTLETVQVRRPQEVIAVETKVFESTPSGTPMVAVMDLVEGIAKGTVRVRDWKTNARPKSLADLAGDLQLGVYAVLAMRKWPWVERVYASQFHTPIAVEHPILIDEEAREDAVTRVDAVVEFMEGDVLRGATEALVGAICTSCPFTALCPEYQAVQDSEAARAMEGF